MNYFSKAVAVAACAILTLQLGTMDAAAGRKSNTTAAGSKQRKSLTAAEIAQLQRTPPWKATNPRPSVKQNIKETKAFNNSAERAIYQNRKKENPQAGRHRKP